jgi:phospholipid transport system substrate-binding protein
LKERTVPLLASRRVVLQLAAALAALPALAPAGLAADGPAAQLIEKVSAEVIELVKAKAGAEREAGIRQVLEQYFDLPAMGRSALGTHWARATEEQRARYLKAVTSAEAHAYAERFGQYGGQKLMVDRVGPGPNGVSLVDSRLTQSGGDPPVKIQWQVHDVGQGPRIIDVKIEGVSMVFTRRSDFNSYIQNHGGQVDALITELESRAAK